MRTTASASTTTKTDPDSIPALDAAARLGIPLHGVVSMAFAGLLIPTASGGISAASLAKAERDRALALERGKA